MKHGAMRGIFLAAISVFSMSAAFGQVTLGATADADAVAGGAGNAYNDDNFGTSNWISENWSGATEVIAHIQFDVSSFAAGTVTSATLRLFQDFNGRSGITYNIHQVMGAWTELGLTHDNRPDLAVSPSASLTTATADAGIWHEWDVTALVQAWVDGAADNHGMAIMRDPNESPWPYFRSRNNDAGNNPELVVNAVPEPATMAALGLGAAAMLRRRRK